MKLSKEQIQYIDDYLKYHKFKYWDIRYEILDHIVNTVEYKMDQGISFDNAMIDVHQSFGNSMKMFWNTHIEYSIFANGNGYKKLIHNKQQELHKKYRNLIFKEFKNFFKSFKNIAFLIILILFEIVLFKSINHKSFLRMNLLTSIFPIIIYLYILIKNTIKKNNSLSLNLTYGMMFLPYFLLGTVNLVLKTNLPIYISYSIIISYFILSFIWFFCSLKVYRKTEKEYTELYKQLKLS